MMQTKKPKFRDILRIRKSDPMPEGANDIPLEAVKKTGDPDFLLDFKDAEAGKWWGTLKYKGVNFVFRYGVCQSIVKPMAMRVSVFDMNIINDDIDFSKEKKVNG